MVMEPVLIIILAIVSILNIVLFFKIWGMTNNVKYILSLLLEKSGYVKKVNPNDSTVTFEKKED